ncbi:MAG: YezD family protein [Oleiharenicola lentus]
MSQVIPPASPATDPRPEWLRVVQQKVETLRYGVVQLIVHDGRVTQIERTEKPRIAPPGSRYDSSGL